MRRALSLLALLLVVAGPGNAVAAAKCAWLDDATAPAVRLIGRMGIYQRVFQCSGDAAGEYTVRVEAVYQGARKPVGSKKGTLKPYGRWPRKTSLHEVAAPSQVCEFAFPPGAPAPLAPDSDGIRQEPSAPVEVEVVFEGKGDLKALNRTERATLPCAVCPPWRSWKNGLGIYDGRAMASVLKSGLRLKAETEAAWYACARRDATLEIRYFTADSDEALRRAIKPVHVQKDLAARFKVEGDTARLDVAVPIEALCRSRKKHVAWEAAGRGLLSRLGGGGRSVHELKCP